MNRLRAAACIFLFLVAAFPLSAAPVKELWPIWTQNNPDSAVLVDHGLWDRFLRKYVQDDPKGLNRVDYAGVSKTDRASLDSYLKQLAATPVSQLNRGQQQALWINLYNALTVQVILEHYPVKSIRDIDISPGLFSDGPWGKKLIVVEGTPLSLDDIEHRILRPIWKDPRLHYVLNCAALGCPNLQPHAATADNWDALLTSAARQYVNNPRGVGFDGERLVVSSIFDWYAGDFGDSEAALLDHLKRYAEAPLRARLGAAGGIDGTDYDWALNEAP